MARQDPLSPMRHLTIGHISKNTLDQPPEVLKHSEVTASMVNAGSQTVTPYQKSVCGVVSNGQMRHRGGNTVRGGRASVVPDPG